MIAVLPHEVLQNVQRCNLAGTCVGIMATSAGYI
jgi:hypothetical protein